MAECCVSVRYATAYFHIHIFILFYYEWELEVADRNGRMAISHSLFQYTLKILSLWKWQRLRPFRASKSPLKTNASLFILHIAQVGQNFDKMQLQLEHTPLFEGTCSFRIHIGWLDIKYSFIAIIQVLNKTMHCKKRNHIKSRSALLSLVTVNNQSAITRIIR